MCENDAKKVTYKVMRVLTNRSYIVWEHQYGAAVNEYVAYGRGDNLILYPKRKLIPSSLALKKRTISIHDTKRGF